MIKFAQEIQRNYIQKLLHKEHRETTVHKQHERHQLRRIHAENS